MPYSMPMGDEKEPTRKVLLPEGLRKFKIIDCEEQTSKAGNQMFVFTLLDIDMQAEDKLYAVAEKGKRWMLKSILAACGVAASADGVYDWDIPDVINKEITGEVIHEPNKYINREGVEVETTQHSIVKIEAIEWDA